MGSIDSAGKGSGWRERHLWYFLLFGLVVAAGVMALALLPKQIVGFSTPGVLVSLALLDFLARRFSISPFSPVSRRKSGEVAYFVVLGVVLVGALLVSFAVARHSDALWLAWTMASLVFLACVSGGWLGGGRRVARTSAP